ncbi:hypothetical protein [Streptomyces monashensis]|uniref:hypothetical protein n=1 Tax=Streptomyces monashensis TaxID=1678012 RepID=UPI0011601D85|nr:hypothetical protein [Streptomyces monashensis]
MADDITVEGDTAPGQGIGLRGREVSFSNSSNDIVRYVRFREGTLDPANGKASLALAKASVMIFDQVSVEFAKRDDIDAVGARNITVQNSMVADPIGQRFAAHTEGGPFTWLPRRLRRRAQPQSAGQGRHTVRGQRRVRLPGRVHGRELRWHLPARRGRQRLHRGTGHRGTVERLRPDGPPAGLEQRQHPGPRRRRQARRHGARRRRGRHRPFHPWSPTSTSPGAAAGSARDAYAYDVTQVGDPPRDAVDALVITDVTSLGTAGRLWSSQTRTGLDNDGYGTVTG